MNKRKRNTKVENATVAPVDGSNDGLDALLAAMTGEAPPIETPPGEVIEASEGDLEAAVAGLEAVEASGTPPEELVEGAEQNTPPVEATETPAKKPKRVPLTDEQKAEKLAAREAKKAETAAKREAAKAAAAAKPPKVFFGADKIARLKATMGEARLNEFAVLTLADAALEGEDLAFRQGEVIALIDKMAVKVKDHATYLLEFMHKGGKLNEIVRRAFVVIKRDGFIKTGDEGNYFAELAAKPYGTGTCRAATAAITGMLRDLQVVRADPTVRGQYNANPESLVLLKVQGMLDAPPAVTPEPVPAAA